MKKLMMNSIIVCVFTVLLMAQVQAQDYRQDRILVKPVVANLGPLHAQLGTRVLRRWPQIENIESVELPPGLTVPQAIAAFQNSGLVYYAEPDYFRHTTVTIPNDPNIGYPKLFMGGKASAAKPLAAAAGE